VLDQPLLIVTGAALWQEMTGKEDREGTKREGERRDHLLPPISGLLDIVE